MCSVQGEINLLCWRTRSIKIPLKVFHLKNPFSENMSHNWHLWLRNWLWRKKKKRSILYKCQQGVQLFPCHNTNRKHLIQCKYTYMIFHFFQWAEQSTLCQKYAGIHAYFIAFYIPLDLSNVFFFFFRQTQVYKCCKFCLCSGVHKGFVKMFMDCGKVL